jgi:glucoamylase
VTDTSTKGLLPNTEEQQSNLTAGSGDVAAKDADQLQEAFVRPGIPPRWTSSSKEGIGTAYSVWFNISYGILDEIYFPTIDHPQTKDMQFLITDGESFFHEERRDLEHEIECIGVDAMGYRVTSSDRAHGYRLVKEIISDPHQSCVFINTRPEGDPEFLKKLRVCALLAPHLDIGGYGNSVRRFKTAGKNP